MPRGRRRHGGCGQGRFAGGTIAVSWNLFYFYCCTVATATAMSWSAGRLRPVSRRIAELSTAQRKEVNRMPAFDGTGPQGHGPLTGRGEGYCAIRLPDPRSGDEAYGYAGRAGVPVRLGPGWELRFNMALGRGRRGDRRGRRFLRKWW
jgi:hypothetical protein